MASIKAIDTESVHRIHSGQVVLELQGAIKELVENSLDAGATSVRIRDNGTDAVEVIDNGSGIAEADWPYIALKHHTSKLPDLELLPQITTFGFRGEALSALCALCESVTITTATSETAPMGAVIKLGRDGAVIGHSGRIARPRGTTVTLSGLFVPLPVRRKEFERNAKREITKALTMLTGYALVPASATPEGRSGVRLKVESLAGGKAGKKTVLLSNDGRGTLRASVTSVWGVKALEGVQDCDLEIDFAVDPRARREGDEATQTIRVVGLISSAAWGMGRSASDRQFFYVNGRPCDLKTIQKTLNETYRSYNTHQFPLAILDFQVPRDSVDINVSPDKRTIMLHSEANLIVALKTRLEEHFTPSRSTYAAEGATQTVKTLKSGMTQTTLSAQRQAARSEDSVAGDDDTDEINATPEAGPSRPVSRSSSRIDEPSPEPPARSKRARNEPEIITALDEDASTESDEPNDVPRAATRPSRSSGSQSRTSAPAVAAGPSRRVHQTLKTSAASWNPDRKGARSGRALAACGSSGREARKSLRDRLAVYASQGPRVDTQEASDDELEEEEGGQLDQMEGGEVEDSANHEVDVVVAEGSDDELDNGDVEMEDDERGGAEEKMEDQVADRTSLTDSADIPARPNSPFPVPRDLQGPIFEDQATSSEDEVSTTKSPIAGSHFGANREGGSANFDEPPDEPLETAPGDRPSAPRNPSSTYRDEITSHAGSGSLTLTFDLPRLNKRMAARRSHRVRTTAPRNAFSALSTAALSDAAGLRNKDAAAAEAALSRVISKADFASMEVLGQFNKGFIITRLRSDDGRKDDLFIVDQHASDEKYNFETLQQSTVIKAQSLIKPRPLQLTAGDEIVAGENLDVLKANGFEVAIDEDKPPGRGERISLVAMPVSKETTFDFKDLEQLLHLLSDSARPAGQMVRCSKARSMFAMRACRKSVMIGKSLTKGQMVQLLRNMGTIDQPWNCPHGRPTMRHLIGLESGDSRDLPRRRVDWKQWLSDRSLGVD